MYSANIEDGLEGSNTANAVVGVWLAGRLNLSSNPYCFKEYRHFVRGLSCSPPVVRRFLATSPDAFVSKLSGGLKFSPGRKNVGERVKRQHLISGRFTIAASLKFAPVTPRSPQQLSITG